MSRPRASRRPLLPVLLLLAAACDPRLPAAEPGSPSPVTPAGAARYVARPGGRVYFPIGCSEVRGVAPDSLRFFRTPEEAQAAGLRPSRDRDCDATVAQRTTDRDPSASLTVVSPADGPGPHGRTCVIARIVDGDTVVCADGTHVRLLIIDTPERTQPGFEAAKRALAALLPIGDTARVELDVRELDRNRRVLAHLYARDVWINHRMIRSGYAVALVVPPNVRHAEALRAAADSARAEGRGLWREGALDCTPREHRDGKCRQR